MSAETRLHRAMVEIVASFFASEGFADAQAAPRGSRLSDRVGDFAPDIVGVPGLHIAVSARRTPRLSESMDKATADAQLAGHGDVACVILHRQGDRGIAEHYAVTTVRDLARLARDAQHAPTP